MKTALLIIATTGLVSGCATALYEGRHSFADGWREAQVTAIVRGDELDRPQFYRCARNLSPDEISAGRFVVLSYSHIGKTKRTLVPAQGNEEHVPGARVLVNLERCDAPLVARRE